MNAFYEEFSNRLVAALLVDFQEIFSLIQGETLYTMALIVDDRASAFYFALNTKEFAERKIVQDPDNKVCYEWEPDNWGYSDSSIQNCRLREVSDFLSENAPLHESFDDFEKNIHQEMIKAMLQLKRNNSELEHVFCFISVSDNSDTEKVEDNSSMILNSREMHEIFIDRFFTNQDFREKASKAWAKKDYVNYVRLIEKISDTLSDSEKKKLDYATQKIESA
ncbi:MAG: DUF4303 domain-containing protein [Peptococcaceae bacterium]|nr:DUF4303 domain-containing protein [Peptococcaceae bacterium]